MLSLRDDSMIDLESWPLYTIAVVRMINPRVFLCSLEDN